MKKLFRAAEALALIAALLLSSFAAFAATGTLVKNTGRRHTVCTALSSQARSYYTGSYTWEKLSALAGVYSPADSLAASRGNPLYTALQTLMTDTHTNRSVVYAGTAQNSLATYWSKTDTASGASGYLYFYADCSSSGSGLTMNREHIWCKANASFYETGGGADLHHLRPSVSTVNAAKGSLIFGNVKTSGNKYTAVAVKGTDICWATDTLFEVKDDIKGDVARILLYVYCRWGQPNLYSDAPPAELPEMDSDDTLNFGEKVVESLDVLLQWMEQDPVDEWEMARNDGAENVQGNRNVFIDYPEYAWLMFGLEVPAGMETPSGKASEPHSWVQTSQTPPACETAGKTVYTCARCGALRTVLLPANGHRFSGGACAVCGKRNDSAAFELTNEFRDGDEVILFWPGAGMALSSTLYNSNYRCGAAVSCDGRSCSTGDETLVWTVEQTSGGYRLLGSDGQPLAASASSYYLSYANPDTVWNLTAAKTAGSVYLKNTDGKCVEWVSKYSDFGAYTYSAGYETVLAMQVYTRTLPPAPVCPTADYPDVPPEDNWAHAGIDYCVERGIMGSVSTETLTFEPNKTCTRAEIVSILYRLAGHPYVSEPNPFTDVRNNFWYTDAILWAYKTGVVSGYGNGKFGPGDKVTREQMAVILKGYTEKIAGKPTPERAGLDTFPDANKVTWSKEAMQWAVRIGMISGKVIDGKTYLAPQGNATRAETASILTRFAGLQDSGFGI